MKARMLLLSALLLVFAALAIAPAMAQDSGDFVFGMVLVGPENDRGWSQAHYEAGQYVEQHVPGTKMVLFPSLNTSDNPEATLQSVTGELVDQGAKMIFTTSDAFQDDTDTVAQNFPDITFINSSGDHVLSGQAPANVGNVMGQMEWGKLIAGCAAGMTTQTGSIGYLGPLINSETRRLASSAYLGARYCYEHFAGGDPANLKFTVTWIGFWFNIPGVTLDPTEETNSFYDTGADVVLSGIDTTEAIDVAGKRAGEGQHVWAIPYDYKSACDQAPDACLGVPYFNWGPAYVKLVQAAMAGTWKQGWEWTTPDWSDINNPDTSAVGFIKGPALSSDNAAHLDEFIANLAAYATNPLTPQNSIALWTGPLNYQDGSELAPAGQVVSGLDVWYLPQLLQGMVGASQ